MRRIPAKVIVLLAIGLLSSGITISSAAEEPGSNDAARSPGRLPRRDGAAFSVENQVEPGTNVPSQTSISDRRNQEHPEIVRQLDSLSSAIGRLERKSALGGIHPRLFLLVLLLQLALIAIAAWLIRSNRRLLPYLRRAEQFSEKALQYAQTASSRSEKLPEIVAKMDEIGELIGRQMEGKVARSVSTDHQTPPENLVFDPGMEKLGRSVEEVPAPREVASAETLAREFLQACDEKTFSLEEAAQWFRAQRSSIEVQDVESRGGENWRLLRIIEGSRAFVIPAVRRSMGGCPLARYFDFIGYNSFDPLRPRDVTALALEVREAGNVWRSEKKGQINVR